jgi:four helix bundle protein
MGVKDFRDLVAWQLADELRREVIAFTEKEPVARDFKYCNQIRDASSSACRNTSEGFGRFRPAENARFLEFARASLSEVQDGLIEAKQKKFVDDELYERLWALSRRALGANTNYMKYLQKCARTGAKPWETGKRRTKNQGTENLEP